MGKKIEYVNEILKNFADLLEEMGEEKVDVEAIRELGEYFLNGNPDIAMAPELASAYKAILEREFHKVLYGDIKGDHVQRVPYGYSYKHRTPYGSTWSGAIKVDQYSLVESISNRMKRCLDKHGVVTVGDYNDICNGVCPGIGNRSISVNYRFGWTKDQVREFRPIRIDGSWSIDIPTPVRLDGRSTYEEED